MLDSLIGMTIKHYKIKRAVGYGQYAYVFEGIDIRDQSAVAIKVILINYNSRDYLHKKEKAVTEASILQSCNSQNIIKFVDSFEANPFFFIISEFCEGGDLSSLILSHSIEEQQAVNYLLQILNGFYGMHQVGVMHRDFKAANILLHKGLCKIADFGLSKKMGNDNITKTNVGTPLTNAPQILSGLPYGFQSDIWSIGVVFYKMLYEQYPYRAPSQLEILAEIRSRQPASPKQKNISEESKNFIRRCLKQNPKERISWAQIYNDPLIKKYEKLHRHAFIDLKKNKQFYLKTKLVERNLPKSQISNEQISEKDRQELMKSIGHIPAQSTLQSVKTQKVNIQEIAQRFQRLYASKRDDIMFFVKFIHPHIKSISHLKINHEVIGFLLSKESYTELQSILNSMAFRSNSFPKEPEFQAFSNSPHFQRLSDEFEENSKQIHKIAESYKQNIKLTTLEIQDQFDIQTIKNHNFAGLVRRHGEEYLRLLACGLRSQVAADRVEVAKLMRAVEYYVGNDRPSASEFEMVRKSEEISVCESKFKKRYNIY